LKEEIVTLTIKDLVKFPFKGLMILVIAPNQEMTTNHNPVQAALPYSRGT
jgi:hypothetical protein